MGQSEIISRKIYLPIRVITYLLISEQDGIEFKGTSNCGMKNHRIEWLGLEVNFSVIFLFSFLVSPLYAASFDCSKATTET